MFILKYILIIYDEEKIDYVSGHIYRPHKYPIKIFLAFHFFFFFSSFNQQSNIMQIDTN